MSITTDSQVHWIRAVNAGVQEMNHKIYRQLLKNINANGTPAAHAYRLSTGVFSLVEREVNTGKTNHVIAYATSGHVQYLNAQIFYDQRADWYAVLDNAFTTTSNFPRDLLSSRIAQVKSEAQSQLAAGKRNLLYNSGTTSTYGYLAQYELTEAPNVGDTITVTLWGTLGTNRTGEIGVFNSHGYTQLFSLTKVAEGVYRGTGQWGHPVLPDNIANPAFNTHLNLYFFPSNNTNSNTITQVKMEYGSTGTAWTPAPEEVDVYP